MADNTTATKQIDDISIDVPEADSERELVPAGAYAGALVGFRQTDKPDWKVQSEQAFNPEKEIDRLQWEWTFELDEYPDQPLTDYTTRSWHPKAKAHKHAAALLGVPSLPTGMGYSTKQLIGLRCQVWVTEKQTKQGDMRNYVDKIVPLPKPRTKPSASPQNGSQAPQEGEDTLGLQKRFNDVWAALQEGAGEDKKAWPTNELRAEMKKVHPGGGTFAGLTAPEQIKIVEHLEGLLGEVSF